jgi:hypothetical protein
MLLRRKLNKYLFLFCLTACTQPTGNNENAVVQVGNHTLTQSELSENLPPSFLSPEDSILAAEHFIRVWINDQLLYDLAQKNIADKKNIDQLVENYRRSLLIYQYQEQLINEKLANNINEQGLLAYYEENKNKFKLDKPLIKGLFLRIPVDAPDIDKTRTWCKNPSATAVGNLEKYSVQNAGSFDYFDTKWVDLNELMNNWPAIEPDFPEALKKKTFFEQKDAKYHYFLNVIEYLLPGDEAPFQYAEPVVKELLINRQKIEFLRKTEDDLYNKALNNGQITFPKTSNVTYTNKKAKPSATAALWPFWYPSHARLSQSHARLSQSHARLSQSHARLPQSHARLSQSHARLPQSHARLSQSHARLPQSHARLSQSHARLSQSHARLSQSHARLYPILIQKQTS